MLQQSISNEAEDINFVIHDLQYSSILEIPFYTRLLHHFFAYFGKINSSVSAPTILGYIYYIIIIVQLLLPAFFIDCEDLWPRESLMTTILYVLCYFFQGPQASIKSARILMSIIISVIFIVLFGILINRAQHFHKTGRVSSIEIKFIYFTFKYIMPLFCPHLMSGIAISFDQIINQNKIDYNVLQIILSIVSFAFYLFLLYSVITPRVIFEDTPSHDYFPILTVATITCTTLSSVVSGISGCVGGKNRCGCSMWMAIQSILVGVLFYFSNGNIKMMIGVISSAAFFASGFASVLLTIDILISKPFSPEILFISTFIIFVVLIILFRFLKQMKVTKVLQFVDSLLDSSNSLEIIFDDTYKKPLNFLFDIQSVIDMWIQFAGDFELFEIAVTKWPDNFNLLLLYSRLLAIFPNKNQQLISTVSKFAEINGGTTQNAYLYQFKHLIGRRKQTSMVPAFQEKLDQISSKTVIINDTLKRFWENILQKNTENFWSSSEHVFSQIDDLDSLYVQLLDDYPNNYQLQNSYLDFVTKVKRDFNESREVKKKLEILKQNGSLKSNFSFEVALQVFPQLNNCIQSNENNNIKQSTTIKNENNDDEMSDLSNEISNDNETNEIKLNNQNEADKDSNNQLENSINELISHSKLGSIIITCVIIVIITIAIIVVFHIYRNYYITKFINKQRSAIDFMLEVDLLVHALNFFCVNVNILPLLFKNTFYSPELFAIYNRELYTRSVAPVLFKDGKVPVFSLTSDSLIDLLAQIKQRFAKMAELLSSLDKNDQYVKQMNFLFYHDKKYGSTLNDMTNDLILKSYDLLKIQTHSEFYSEDSLYYYLKNKFVILNELYSNIAGLANTYSSSSFDTQHDKLNEIMILVNLLTLILLSLPYLIQLFLLSIHSESIAESFTLFPNTEIRSIITEFGKESSKMEEDTTQISTLNNIRGNTKLSGVAGVLSFTATFFAVLICSLAIYFEARGFIDDAEFVSVEIYTLTPSFASLSLSFIQALRCYMLTHDGDFTHITDMQSNLYGSKNDNLTELVNSAFTMLNLTYTQFSTGMWGKNSGMDVLIKNNEKSFDYFTDSFEKEYMQNSPAKTFFEELATDDFYESINHVKDYLWYYIIDLKAGLDIYDQTGSIYSLTPATREQEKMVSSVYWFSNFSEINRTQIYFNMIQKDVYNKITKYKMVPNACFYVILFWQLLICLLMILLLISRYSKIKKSLLFYRFIKPEIILQNQKILNLIENGRLDSQDSNTNFSNSDYIISRISQGVVITEKNFNISYYNDSFVQKCQLDSFNIKGVNLNDLITKDDEDKSWPNFIQHIEDSISGKYRTQFKEDVTAKLKNEQICHFNCTVICLTKNGVSNNGGLDLIDKVAIIFDDNTEIFMKEQLIAQEKDHLNKMLSNVMPSRMIQNFVNSGECISFIVQSVSIGMIRIKTLKKFNDDTYEEFTFYNEIFDRFDTEIKQFELLTKINNFSHTYSFVGGLFSEINKPERHAEEAIKFSLKLLSIIPELQEKYGAEIHLTIGVHTGGPIVAGVLSFDHPTFQIIGTVNEMANQMKNKGMPDQICITRAVYELIFSASFKVQEQGDTAIRGGKIIPTYLVRL